MNREITVGKKHLHGVADVFRLRMGFYQNGVALCPGILAEIAIGRPLPFFVCTERNFRQVRSLGKSYLCVELACKRHCIAQNVQRKIVNAGNFIVVHIVNVIQDKGMYACLNIARRLLHFYGVKIAVVIKTLRHFCRGAVQCNGNTRQTCKITAAVLMLAVDNSRSFAYALNIADDTRVYIALNKINVKRFANIESFVLVYRYIHAHSVETVVIVHIRRSRLGGNGKRRGETDSRA